MDFRCTIVSLGPRPTIYTCGSIPRTTSTHCMPSYWPTIWICLQSPVYSKYTNSHVTYITSKSSALKMEQIECSQTLANINQTPGKHPKENTLKTYFACQNVLCCGDTPFEMESRTGNKDHHVCIFENA
jgi:hypothetical protein